MVEGNQHRQILIIGAGPAGFYAARKLVESGAYVTLLNRDIRPGGLAEYGIYYDKYRMKEGLRKQFRQILALPEINYIGNVSIGNNGDITLQELRGMGFDAIMVTVGAQGTKKLDLPGEDLIGVYHAKDIVFHYNQLPPFSTRIYRIGAKVAIVGVGNVMMDIAHWLVRDLKVDEITAIARRGPAEVKFTEKEMEYVIANFDVADLDKELERCAPFMEAVGQDPQKARDYLLADLPKAIDSVSKTRVRFNFLTSPIRILGNEKGEVIGLEVEDNKLLLKGDATKAVGLGTHRLLAVDSVIFSIGDSVDPDFGLAVQQNEFVMNPQPAFPIDGISYEVYDPDQKQPVEGIFAAGWSRQSSYGLVGLARRDAENGARAILEYLNTRPAAAGVDPTGALDQHLRKVQKRLINKEDIMRLDAAEMLQQQKLGVEEFKFKTNEEMLAAIG